MAISRRQLLQLGLLTAVTTATGTLRAEEGPPRRLRAPTRRTTPSILQGATDESRTQFSVVHAVEERYAFQVTSARGGTWQPDRIETLTLAGQKAAITRVFFSGLYLGEDFNLMLQEMSQPNKAEARIFRMLDTRNPRPRFAVCSCMDDNEHAPEIWRDLVQQRPDFILFIGDSVYVDYGRERDSGEARLWRRFAEARSTLDIFFSQRLVPIFATWDDHDFGLNDSGREYPHAEISRKNFMSFYAMEPSHCSILERGPGVSSRFVIGGQQFFLMDDRSYRIAGRSNERYAHWGQEQEEWMLAHAASHPGMSWIANGSQVFPQMPFKESFSGEHPVQFAAVSEALRRLNQRVIFLSGDVHFTEISQVEKDAFGYQTYELTSSSIHSGKLPGAPDIIPNGRRIASTGNRNYLLIESIADGYGCRFGVESRTPSNRVNFRLDLTV